MASEEHRIRERLWARAQVWREQHSPEKASAGCPTRRDLYHSPNIPRTTARPTPPAAPTPKKTPSPGFRDKPSGSLVRRLGLGRIDDRGAGLGKKGKTAFAAAYRGGEISRWLRVDQNGSYPVVVFAAAAADVPLGRALPLCFEGLSERCHPLCLLARRGTLMLLAEHPERAQVPACVEIKILRRVRAKSSRRPPRHRRDTGSMAWRHRSRASQNGRVIADMLAVEVRRVSAGRGPHRRRGENADDKRSYSGRGDDASDARGLGLLREQARALLRGYSLQLAHCSEF